MSQEVHGHARIPPDYYDQLEMGWVEAARWLQKNAKLFLKNKLPEKRYALMREILGTRLEGNAPDPLRVASNKGGDDSFSSDFVLPTFAISALSVSYRQ